MEANSGYSGSFRGNAKLNIACKNNSILSNIFIKQFYIIFYVFSLEYESHKVARQKRGKSTTQLLQFLQINEFLGK